MQQQQSSSSNVHGRVSGCATLFLGDWKFWRCNLARKAEKKKCRNVERGGLEPDATLQLLPRSFEARGRRFLFLVVRRTFVEPRRVPSTP